MRTPTMKVLSGRSLVGLFGCALITTASFVANRASHAATVTLNSGDAFGLSSFNTAGNWSTGTAPSPGNDYVVSIDRLRTPADGNSYFFEGDSLTVTSTGRLMYKGLGNGPTITIGNLILSGGLIDHRSSFADVFILSGALNITAASTIAPQQGAITINSTISGSGDITVPATDNFNAYPLTLTAMNSYTGSMSVAGNLVLAAGGGLTFDIGASGVNNGISGSGTSTFDGMFTFDLTEASANPGDSWTIVNTATKTFNSSFFITDFVEIDNVWTSGVYEFSETTGVLTVVPEPSAAAAILSGTGILLGMHRCRRRALSIC